MAGTPNVVLGLAGALVLAVLAAHPAVRRIEIRLGMSVLATAGLPFLVLGALLALPSVGVLSPEILADLRPAFNFALAWIGFVIGLQFDLRWLAGLRRGVTSAAFAQSLAAFVVTLAFGALALLAVGVPLSSATIVRDAVILAACAAASAPLGAALITGFTSADAAVDVEAITRIDEVVPLAALALAAALVRPAGVEGSLLPVGAWFILALGVGVAGGIVAYVLLRGAQAESERIALLLGAVALVAGTASHMALPPAALGLMAGAVLANLPLSAPRQVQATMLGVERPLFLILLLVAGAEWRPFEWQGWLIAVVFVLARIVGKRLGALWATRIQPQLPEPGLLAALLMPLSPAAVVVVVSAGALFGGEGNVVFGWAVNAVIVASVLNEVIARALRRGRRALPVTDLLEPRLPGAPG